MMDEDIFIDSFEPHVTSTGIKIYEKTTKISKEDKKITTAQIVDNESLWDKIKGLFK